MALTSSYHWNRWAVRVGSRLGLDGRALHLRSYVWDLWHGTTPGQARRQMEAIHERHGRLASVLGWSLPPPETTPWVRGAPHPQNTHASHGECSCSTNTR